MKQFLKRTAFFATAFLLVSPVLAENPHSSFGRAPVRNMTMTPDPIPFTAATLRRFNSGLSMTLVSAVPVDPIAQRAGYSVWWAVFNRPENCTHPLSDSNGVISACSAADLSLPAVQASVFWATGSVVVGFGDNTNTGLLNVDGQAGLGPDGIPGQSVDGPDTQILRGPGGLTNLSGAEIHVVVRNHGLLDGMNDFREVASSQMTGNPLLIDQAQNIQFAVFRPSKADE